MTNKVLLKLYITGQTSRSEQAVVNLRRICEQQLHNQFDLDIIDILEQPELAEIEKIIATPTLVRVSPPPARRIIGDLSDTEKVLFGLSLHHVSEFLKDGGK